VENTELISLFYHPPSFYPPCISRSIDTLRQARKWADVGAAPPKRSLGRPVKAPRGGGWRPSRILKWLLYHIPATITMLQYKSGSLLASASSSGSICKGTTYVYSSRYQPGRHSLLQNKKGICDEWRRFRVVGSATAAGTAAIQSSESYFQWEAEWVWSDFLIGKSQHEVGTTTFPQLGSARNTWTQVSTTGSSSNSYINSYVR
jgi:hypothetical protein